MDCHSLQFHHIWMFEVFHHNNFTEKVLHHHTVQFHFNWEKQTIVVVCVQELPSFTEASCFGNFVHNTKWHHETSHTIVVIYISYLPPFLHGTPLLPVLCVSWETLQRCLHTFLKKAILIPIAQNVQCGMKHQMRCLKPCKQVNNQMMWLKCIVHCDWWPIICSTWLWMRLLAAHSQSGTHNRNIPVIQGCYAICSSFLRDTKGTLIYILYFVVTCHWIGVRTKQSQVIVLTLVSIDCIHPPA